MNDWLSALMQGLQHEPALVRVLVVAARGSTPREAGAWMLVGAHGSTGTIGGGHLEWKAEAIARDLLAQVYRSDHGTEHQPSRRIDRFTLGATLGQCCGGVVELWFECFEAAEQADLQAIQEAVATAATSGAASFLITPLRADHEHKGRRCLTQTELQTERPGAVLHLVEAEAPPAQLLHDQNQVWLIEKMQPAITPLWLYGAGHVGRALVRVLVDLPLQITWIDSRADLFPAITSAAVTPRISEQPADEVADAPADALHLVMTHRHDFDYAICQALLRRGEFRWAGMIGSDTKAASFRARLSRAGYSAEQTARIVSPIGLANGLPKIRNKQPAAIAIAAAAQILQVLESSARSQAHATQPANLNPPTTQAKAYR